jgi:hypothetical protein
MRRPGERTFAADVARRISYSHSSRDIGQSRRDFAKEMLATAALAGLGYLSSQIPLAYAQGLELLVGLLEVPVTRDGQISEGEYNNDTIDNKFEIHIQNSSFVPEGHIYAKFEPTWTYFGFDFPTDIIENTRRDLVLYFDTPNTGKQTDGAPGVYNLELKFTSPKNPYEADLFPPVGTPFIESFKKGEDYDWQYSFGPSPLNPTPHTQFEVQILTDILSEYSNEIGFGASYLDSTRNALSFYSHSPILWIKMKYLQQVVPELK